MLSRHGEHLFVERKRKPPQDGIGRVAASFANSLGGWILLGVEDDGSLFGYTLPKRADAQSHIGQILANEVEPLPPFVATSYTLDGVDLVVIRVFESSDTPHLVKATGAVPIRTPKGTEPITDQAVLLQLARRGEAALDVARVRLASDVIALELVTPDRPDLVASHTVSPTVFVRAALVTSPPSFASWATSKSAPAAAIRTLEEVARILGASITQPEISSRARGVGVGCNGQANARLIAIRVAFDAGGVLGARITQMAQAADLHSIDAEYVSPLVLALGDALAAADVHGRTVWRCDITLPRQDFKLEGAPRQTGRPFFASGELSSPPEYQASAQLTKTWVREFAREMGVPAYD